MINPSTLEFLSELRENNYREWFHSQKPRYEAAKTNVLDTAGQMLDGIRQFDPSLGFPDLRKCIYRIARDTRFSVNKEPYKTNMGVVFSPSGTTHGDLSCYYMHVEPGGSFISCGVYMPSADVLKAVRKAIDDDWEEFEAILNDKSFKKAFGDLSREEKVLKRVPAGFAKDSPSADYLKLYHFYVQQPVSDAQLCSERYMAEAVQAFKTTKPLNDFLNRAIRNR